MLNRKQLGEITIVQWLGILFFWCKKYFSLAVIMWAT